MKAILLGLVIGCTMVLAINSAGAVNCEQVRRYLATGRSAEDIAENMVIDVNEVKKCQQEGAAKQAPATPAAPKAKAPY